MSYQVLARKWRPKSFTDVVGQQHVLTALSNSLRENRLHHSYLFSGTRGVGKTSIARLFAKGLNCITNGVTAEPCGQCEHCKAIEEGRFIDLIEIDAASRTKVEDTRELLDNVQYKPVQGRYKVYLIDEVHMLSRHSFNALLKTLEEPPEYVKFLLATTDPHKLPITILSRCMQFNLKALDQEQIKSHLMEILTAEKIAFEEIAIEKLAKAAQGSIRDSLSLTDQAIATSNGNITLSVVQDMLGILDDSQAIDILYAIHLGDGERLMKGIQTVAEKSGAWQELLDEIAETLHKIAMIQLLPTNLDTLDSSLDVLAKQISPEEIQFLYQVIVTGKKELTFSPNPRIGVEMILLRALAFHPKSFKKRYEIESQQDNIIQENNQIESKQNAVATSHVQNQIVSKESSTNIDKNARATKNISVEEAVSQEIDVTLAQQKDTVPVVSTALSALDAIEQLNSIAEQKKNANKQDLNALSRFTQSLQPSSSVENAHLLSVSIQENNTDDIPDEDYHWKWQNPDLESAKIEISASEIRKNILDNIPDNVERKITDMATKQDEWSEIIEKAELTGMVLQLARNTVLIEHSANNFNLILDKENSQLQRYQDKLQKKLSDFYGDNIQLSIEKDKLEEKMTPQKYRDQSYEILIQQAQKDLDLDDKLQFLKREFDAELDLSTVRPV